VDPTENHPTKDHDFSVIFPETNLAAVASQYKNSTKVRTAASVRRYPDNQCGKTAKALCASHTNDAHSCMKCIEENIGTRPDYLVCSLSDVDIICGVALEGNLHEEVAGVADPNKTQTLKPPSLHIILGSVSMLLVFATLAFFSGVM
jgi:hypothetical protein